MEDEKAQLDLLDRILGRNLNWVASADAKVTPMLAINTAMLGVIAALVPKATDWTVLSGIATAIATLSLFGGVVFLVLATFPRLNGPRSSLLFFGGIASYEEEQYLEKILQGITPDLLKDYARQCHRNAEIAQQKYRFIKYAMVCTFFSVPAWVLSVALLYQIKCLILP